MQIAMPALPCETIVTDINIALGDITYIVSDKLLGADYADLRAAHQESVTQAQDIVARNINILVTLVKEIGHQLGALPTPTGGPVRQVADVAKPAVPVADPAIAPSEPH